MKKAAVALAMTVILGIGLVAFFVRPATEPRSAFNVNLDLRSVEVRSNTRADGAVTPGKASTSLSADQHAPPPEHWVPIKFEHEVPNFLVGWLKKILGTDYPIVYTEAFKYAAVELKVGNKSQQDIITYIDHPDFCSSGGCSIDIYKFDPSSPSYKAIGTFCSKGQVAFAGTVTNGYRDPNQRQS